MANMALEICGLVKHYPSFTLDRVTFCVPQGSIVGLIGENGAGKSTAIKAILGLIQTDGGTLSILGESGQAAGSAVRGQIGVVFDTGNFPEYLSPMGLGKLLKPVYPSWDPVTYRHLLDRLGLPADRTIKRLSKGMKMKLALAAALSHHARLLILDEPTSGLDPIVRDDILDLFLEFVQEEDHAILVSSHITSDLEKVADHIVFLHQGTVLFEEPKDELLYRYGILKCGAAQFAALETADMLAYRKQDYAYQVLVADRDAARKKYPKAVIDAATIEEIMVMYVKGAQPCGAC